MRQILHCECGEYVMTVCKCGKEAVNVVPPKYSPDDKYSSYRRQAKEPQRKERGVL